MSNWTTQAEAAAHKYGIPPNLFVRQIRQESGGNPNARSPAGALGIAQIMPGTARSWGVNPLDPGQSLDAAAKAMAGYARQFGSYEKALRAYNAGPANVAKSYQFRETNQYVSSILAGVGGSGGSGGTGRRYSSGREKITTTRTGANPAYGDQRKALLLSYLADRSSPDALLNLAVGFQGLPSPTTSSSSVRYSGGSGMAAAAAGGANAAGKATFDGKTVRADFAHQLAWARRNGWQGTVTSGYRNPQQQMAAAKNYGLQHYGPAGPLASNHVKNRAVDVTDPQQLDSILRRYPGKRTLVWGGPVIGDQPHFSTNGH